METFMIKKRSDGEFAMGKSYQSFSAHGGGKIWMGRGNFHRHLALFRNRTEEDQMIPYIDCDIIMTIYSEKTKLASVVSFDAEEYIIAYFCGGI